MEERQLTLDELVLELKAHVMAIRSAIERCPELESDPYMSIAVVENSDGEHLNAWFNNSPNKKSPIPKVHYILGYNDNDPNLWERG